MSGNVLQHFILFSIVANGVQVADHVDEFGFNVNRERVGFCRV